MSGYYIVDKDGKDVEHFNTKDAAETFVRRRPDRDSLEIEERGVRTLTAGLPNERQRWN